MNDWLRQSWIEAEPERLAQEREAMANLAPEMVWLDGEPAGGWEGLAPAWPFERPEPPVQDSGRNRFQPRRKVGKALWAKVEFPEYQQRPAFAENLGSPGQRAELGVLGHEETLTERPCTF